MLILLRLSIIIINFANYVPSIKQTGVARLEQLNFTKISRVWHRSVSGRKKCLRSSKTFISTILNIVTNYYQTYLTESLLNFLNYTYVGEIDESRCTSQYNVNQIGLNKQSVLRGSYKRRWQIYSAITEQTNV